MTICKTRKQGQKLILTFSFISSSAPDGGRWEYWKKIDFAEEHKKEVYRRVNRMLRGESPRREKAERI